MAALASIRRVYERLLEAIVLALVSSLTVIVVLGVVYRKLGASLSWYDEVASVNLAWVTYYGAALAALKRSHIGVPELLRAVSGRTRLVLFALGEACVFAFFVLLAWVGWQVVEVLAGDNLISLPWVSSQVTQSVIPVGALLFVVAQALSLPEGWRRIGH